MPRETPIAPGQKFHLPAAQQANLANLMKVLSSKKATEALSELGKTEDSTWGDINNTVKGLNDLVSAGGIDKILAGFQETVDLQISSALSPLKNEIDTLIAEALNPVKTIVQDIINDLTDFIAENKTGAAIGGIAGQIAGLVLPGGELLVAVGALIGAGIEELLNRMGSLTEDVWIEDLEKAINMFEGTPFGDTLEKILALLEEEVAARKSAEPGISRIRLPDGTVVRVVDVDEYY